MRESTVEEYLVARVKALRGEIRKVQWPGRQKAPDRVVMLRPHTLKGPGGLLLNRDPRTIWVELKRPDTILTFPANAHERAQAREHKAMREAGQIVLVLGTKEQIDKEFPCPK